MKRNKWKTAFFGLAGLVILGIVIILAMAFMPAKDEPNPKGAYSNGKDVQFHINATKEDLNKMINHYIKKEGLNGPVDYRVLLTDEVELYGTIPVFSQDLNLKMTFEPEALKNGDLVLRQKSISLGRLNLPVSYVLKFIRDSYKLPDWVKIQPNDKMVYVSFHNMKLKSDMKVRADEFNLKDDNISFTLLVPTQ
ncbi:YpmS family protein [Falsibacillus pallidus]|uniref:Uncharacterized protein YpmS n=1 Tax=Falsibacillus pallidus TaxID=493781 RepID=A0A370GIP7_9BACI|nr:YpmS family protein [Falsibacillus pallidus]RDI43079.1 uncharacterized protein YpmS [Falsibacillus pallidus]